MSILKKIKEKRKAKKAKKAGLKVPVCVAVIVAAGSSTRMNGTDKLFAELDGLPVLARTLLAFEKNNHISDIIVVTNEKSIIKVGDLCRNTGIRKLRKIVCGGDTRTVSVQNGLNALPDGAELVAIHDGARPLITQDIITASIHAAHKFSAAAPAIPVTDTIKVVESGNIVETPERSKLYAVQTPQVFELSLIKAAIFDAVKNGAKITDDCAAVERLGGKVRIVDGSADNIKITLPSDLVKAEAVLKYRKGGRA